jgi:hypothetical protein
MICGESFFFVIRLLQSPLSRYAAGNGQNRYLGSLVTQDKPPSRRKGDAFMGLAQHPPFFARGQVFQHTHDFRTGFLVKPDHGAERGAAILNAAAYRHLAFCNAAFVSGVRHACPRRFGCLSSISAYTVIREETAELALKNA